MSTPTGTEGISAVSRDNFSSKIYRRLRSQIMNGAFEPGERLRIRKLAAQFETSTTPVREAIMQLVREGALELRPGHELRVPTLTIEAYTQIRQTRAPLERLATELATPHISRSRLNSLSKINTNFLNSESNHRWKDALSFNLEFHFKLYGYCNNPFLIKTIENLWLITGPFLINQYPSPFYAHDSNHPHLRLIAALGAGDAKAAGEIVYAGLDPKSSLIVDRLKREARDSKLG